MLLGGGGGWGVTTVFQGCKAYEWGSLTLGISHRDKYESSPSSCSTQHERGVSLTAPSFRASTPTAPPQFIAIAPEVCNTTTRTATSLRIQAERQGKNKEHRPISHNFTATTFAWICVVVHVHVVCKRVVLHETGETSFKTADEGNRRWLWIFTWWIWCKRWCGNSWWCIGKNMEEVSKEPEKSGVGQHAPVSTLSGRTFVSLLVGNERQGSFSIGVERAVRKL